MQMKPPVLVVCAIYLNLMSASTFLKGGESETKYRLLPNVILIHSFG